MSIQTLHRRTHMHMVTLTALDHGDVALCEWTVGILAIALHVEPWQLLKAQNEALQYQTRAAKVS
ncbi:hypothetical protein A9973_13870 [Achromobacter sp. UMC46]|nr:hypothetical protein [Achromobacter sp. UMC46]